MAHVLLDLISDRSTCFGVTVGLVLCQVLLLYHFDQLPYNSNGYGAIKQSSDWLQPTVNTAAETRLINQTLAVVIILDSCNAGELDTILQTWGRDVPPHLITLYYTCCDKLYTSELAFNLIHRHLSCSNRIRPSLLSVISDLNASSSSPQWYLIASRHNYVNYDLLVQFVNQLDSHQPLYFGKPVTNDSTKPWKTYCARYHGIVISQAVLQGLEISCHSSSTHEASCLGESIWDSHHVRCWERLSEAWSPFSTYNNSESLKEQNSLILSHMQRRQMIATHFTRKIAKYKRMLQKQRHTECLMNQLQQHHFIVNSSLNHSTYQENTTKIEVCLQQLNLPITSKDDVQSWIYYLPAKDYKYYDQHSYPTLYAPASTVLVSELRFKYFTGNYTFYARYSGENGMTYFIDYEEEEEEEEEEEDYYYVNDDVDYDYDDTDELERTILEIGLNDFEDNDTENNSITDETLQATVHFVVSIGNGYDNVVKFMIMYDHICLSTHQHTSVILVVFGKELYNSITELIKQYQTRYPEANFTTVLGEGEFSRSRAINLGMRELGDDDLAFFCDIGIDITDTGFLDRCRRNTIKGERVYFPEIFRYYNLSMTYRNKTQPQGFPPISRETGHWIAYGYGMVCIYKQDHLAVGRMDECIEGWGREDNEYYNKVRKKLVIFRAPDPSLRHYWHPKNCTAITTKDKMDICRGSSLMVLGERRQLAMYIMENNLTIHNETHPN